VALDQSFIGRTYPASPPYQVGIEKIREFADAIGDPNPVYRDIEAARAAGHPTVIAPPTFAIIIINNQAIYTIVADPALGLDWRRVVHGEQSFTYRRPIMAGDGLVLVATIENVMTRAGNDFVTVRTDLNTEAGETVCVGTTMLVARGTA
jgi:acyl dehydratase